MVVVVVVLLLLVAVAVATLFPPVAPTFQIILVEKSGRHDSQTD